MKLGIALTALALLATPTLAAKPEEAAEKAADSRNKMVCKRFLETGSLVKGYRECKTKWEWEREREARRTLNVANSCRDAANGGFGCT